jgi:4-amino-4-deoxy-L-arabinose transferase-like glycosyltransferase
MRTLRHPDTPWVLLVALAAALYLFGLGGPYAPTNGDEMVYIHIARMTGESGHWLPLQSELIGTRNTKPPLLIWQAIVASDWGRNWNLFALRLPSIFYTFASTALIGFFTLHLSARVRTACLAASLYLLYFSTFRYGRVYLTSAPETFWLALPMWWLLWQRLRQPSNTRLQIGWGSYTWFGVVMGLGAAYKSFALLAPAAAAFWCAYLLGEKRWHWPTLLRTTAGATWSVLLGVAIFALWFVLDPDPAAVWQEFVVAENAGKMSNNQGYWQAALYGAYPMWTQLLAYPVNAGLLALNTMGFCWWALRQAVTTRWIRQLSPAHWVLLSWLLVWLIVFTIPSQRSERYVIPAMPALAIAMALVWERIHRLWALASLLIAAPALVILARIAWVIGGMDVGSAMDADAAVLACAVGLVSIVLGLRYAAWTRNASLVACLTVYACFALMVAPLSNPQSDYSTSVQQQLQGQRIAVPNGFTGQYENYHFVFPGPQVAIYPYDAEGRNTGERYPEMPSDMRLLRLLNEFDAVVWLQDSGTQATPSCLPQCRVVAQRWHVRSRHKSGEITLDNLWYPQQWLFNREWLITKT